MGFVYILTNDAFRENLVKIGKAKDLDKRVKDLSSATGVPLNFKAYAALEVENYHDVERYIQDLLNDVRVNKSREFFNISPEDAYHRFEKLQIILPGSILHKYSNNYTGYLVGYSIPVGSVLVHKTGNKAVVATKDRLEYNGKLYTLSGLSDEFNGKSCGHPSRYWSYEDKSIEQWRK